MKLRVIVVSFIVLHAATGLLEVYAFRAGLSAAIWANVAVRVLAVALFASLGLRGGLVSLVTPPAFLAASALAYRRAGVGKATMYRRWGKELFLKHSKLFLDT